MEKELKNPNKELEEQETQELDLGALEQVTGGSLKDVVYTPVSYTHLTLPTKLEV